MSRAQRKHARAVSATLAAAFVDEPALSWVLPDRSDRHERLVVFFNSLVPGGIANGLALRSEYDEAVTLWRMPGRIRPGFVETLLGMPGFMKALGAQASRAQIVGQSVSARAPRDFPYWYLQFAGVAPAHQGKGWGGVAIRAGLEQARAAGMPVYLETSKESNFQLYRHLGFKPLEQWDVPGGGPHFWSMLWKDA